MTLKYALTDDELGQFYKRMNAIVDRLGKSLPFDETMTALQAIHDGKEPVIPTLIAVSSEYIEVNFDETLEQMIARGRYDWTNSGITVKRFPVVGTGTKRYLPKVFTFGKSVGSQEAADLMAQEGFLPARHEHGLAFAAKFPKEQLKQPIACLGSSAEVRGDRGVVCLGRIVAKRGLDLYCWDRDWDDGWGFLGVRELSDA